MVAAFPHLPLFEHQGLGVALVSYAGRLYVGLTGEWDLAADIDVLVADLGAAFEALAPHPETRAARATTAGTRPATAADRVAFGLPRVPAGAGMAVARDLTVDSTATDETAVQSHL